MKRTTPLGLMLIAGLCALDLFVWYTVVFAAPPRASMLAMLDVGQGDSTLLTLPGGATILTDAGPDRSVLSALQGVLPQTRRYIDLAVISHPQKDHFNGFNELLKRYTFGAFIINGRTGEISEWKALVAGIRAAHIPLITLGAGDSIRNGESEISILSPDDSWQGSGELNDTGLVELVHTPDFRALLTADIGTNIEDYLLPRFTVAADILKVGHHGSKYSSSAGFLTAVHPVIAVIGVGAGNRYGHPTREALERLSAAGAHVFRTDQNGTIRIVGEHGTLKVFVENNRNPNNLLD